MPVAKLTLEIEIPHAQSLKDRRQVVRSLKDTLRRGFNVSVAEMDEFPVWNRATIAIAALSRSESYLQGQLVQVEEAARRVLNRFGAELLDSFAETLDGEMGSGDEGQPEQVTNVREPEAVRADADCISAMVSLPDIHHG